MRLTLSLIGLLLLSGCASLESACHANGGVYIKSEDSIEICVVGADKRERRLELQDPTK